MKYKLINLETKDEHFCDKVTIDGFDYYVSDKIVNTNDYYITSNRIEQCSCKEEANDLTNNCKKVIATSNPSIDIPQVGEFEII